MAHIMSKFIGGEYHTVLARQGNIQIIKDDVCVAEYHDGVTRIYQGANFSDDDVNNMMVKSTTLSKYKRQSKNNSKRNKVKKSTYSFSADPRVMAQAKAHALEHGLKVSNLIEMALNDYVNRGENVI